MVCDLKMSSHLSGVFSTFDHINELSCHESASCGTIFLCGERVIVSISSIIGGIRIIRALIKTRVPIIMLSMLHNLLPDFL